MTQSAHDYEEKIAKLLAKAEAKGTTPEEAESLSAAAERLMVKYGIDRALISAKRAASSTKPEEIITGEVLFTGDYRDAYIVMANAIATGLGNVKTWMYSGSFDSFRKTGKQIFIVGYESDVEQAKILINSLQLQGVSALNVWWKTQNASVQSERFRMRREFIGSFGSGAGHRIKAARAVAVSESSTGTELVLRDRMKDVEDAMAHLNLRSRTSRKTVDWSARQAGYAAGQRANTGDKQFGDLRKAIS